MWTPLERYLSLLSQRRRVTLIIILIATLVVGTGITAIDSDLKIARFDIESTGEDDTSYVEEHFATDSSEISLVVVRGGNVLSRETLTETIELQEAIRENETIAPTLSDDRPTVDSTTVFVESYLRSLGSFGELTLEDKSRTFHTFTAGDIETELPKTLDDDHPIFGPGTSVSTLLPADHDGSAQADARLVLVMHDDVNDEDLLDAQLTIETLANEHVEAETFVFGDALVEQRTSDATGAAFAALGPLALFLVVGLLLLAYRDLLDVLLALIGISVVLVWTAGFVGWAGIELTQLLVAVPWLLLGLTIDYGLHVMMRYREARTDDESTPIQAMTVSLAGVLVALSVTTLTTASGFLSGVFGPAPVRDFGVVAAFGIISAFIVFGAFVPALKLELDETLTRKRGSRPVGRSRAVSRFVHLGVIGAKRAPIAVVVVALLLAVGGVHGATHVDTSVDRTDFYPGDPPEWASSIPGLETTETSETLQEQATYLDERFEIATGDDNIEFLIRGAVANESGVSAIHTVEREARETDVLRKSDGEATVYTPFDVLERFSEFDDRIVDAMNEADTTGDGRLDGNVTAAFDATYEIAESEMNTVVYRDDVGRYQAVRVVVPVESGTDAQTVTAEMRTVARVADEEPGVTVTATGSPVVTADTQTALLRLLVESFVIALAVTFALLIALFWFRYRSIQLGIITVVPVILALSWILGTMYLVGIPYNVETSIITGIAIGLGVDYAIHVSARFEQEVTTTGEQQQRDEPLQALSRAVENTGGTLFASAATTTAAVGVLLATFIPPLQRFGLVMVLTVVYAFIASVFVLPSLLILRSRLREWRR